MFATCSKSSGPIQRLIEKVWNAQEAPTIYRWSAESGWSYSSLPPWKLVIGHLRVRSGLGPGGRGEYNPWLLLPRLITDSLFVAQSVDHFVEISNRKVNAGGYKGLGARDIVQWSAQTNCFPRFTYSSSSHTHRMVSLASIPYSCHPFLPPIEMRLSVKWPLYRSSFSLPIQRSFSPSFHLHTYSSSNFFLPFLAFSFYSPIISSIVPFIIIQIIFPLKPFLYLYMRFFLYIARLSMWLLCT